MFFFWLSFLIFKIRIIIVSTSKNKEWTQGDFGRWWDMFITLIMVIGTWSMDISKLIKSFILNMQFFMCAHCILIMMLNFFFTYFKEKMWRWNYLWPFAYSKYSWSLTPSSLYLLPYDDLYFSFTLERSFFSLIRIITSIASLLIWVPPLIFSHRVVEH